MNNPLTLEDMRKKVEQPGRRDVERGPTAEEYLKRNPTPLPPSLDLAARLEADRSLRGDASRSRGDSTPRGRPDKRTVRRLDQARADLDMTTGRVNDPLGSAPPPLWLHGGGASLECFAFGFSRSGMVLTLKAGTIYHPPNERAYVLADSQTLSADGDNYVGVEYDLNAGTAAYMALTSTEPECDSSHIRFWTVKFVVTSGAVTSYVVGHVGNFYVLGVYAGQS